MKYIKEFVKTVSIAVVSLALINLAASSATTYASPTASLALTPGTNSVTQGSTAVETITVNAGNSRITGVQACITYDAAKLSLINTDTTHSKLSYATPNSSADCKSGQLQVSRFGTNKPSGSFTLATLTIKALGADAKVPLEFDVTTSYIRDDSTVDSSGSYQNILSGSTGAIIAIGNVPALGASANPASPNSMQSDKPAFTGSNSAQASSSDVGKAAIKNTRGYMPHRGRPAHRSDNLIVIWTLTMIIAGSILLKKFIEIPLGKK